MPAVCPSIFTISIHALREEGDSSGILPKLPDSHFYPRPPRGGRQLRLVIHCESSLFLSTPSARRATRNRRVKQLLIRISIHALREEGDRIIAKPYWARRNFYPRPPRGGRLPAAILPVLDARISIHALREEGDKKGAYRWRLKHNFYPRPPRGGRRSFFRLYLKLEVFLSTPSARRATRRVDALLVDLRISIHALREEGDSSN